MSPRELLRSTTTMLPHCCASIVAVGEEYAITNRGSVMSPEIDLDYEHLLEHPSNTKNARQLLPAPYSTIVLMHDR